jgi:hypothetical protein
MPLCPSGAGGDSGHVLATCKVEHVQLLSEDVAAANIRSRPVHADGAPIVGANLYVLVQAGSGWKFAVGHTILIADEAIEQQWRERQQAKT